MSRLFKIGGAAAATGLAVWGVSRAFSERESFKDREVSAVAQKAMEQLEPELINGATLRKEKFLGVFPGRRIENAELLGALAVEYDKTLEVKKEEPRFKVRGCDWDLTLSGGRPVGMFKQAIEITGVDPDSIHAKEHVWAGVQPCEGGKYKVFCWSGENSFVKEEV